MREFLIFTLAAPFASFGAVAVGERRPSWDRPSKSQVLGLVAGALGIERTEETLQIELGRALSFAVRVDTAGQIQSDYHTTQVPPQRRNRRFATRADELAVAKTELKTILSRRETRMGAYYTIALSKSGDNVQGPSLQNIERDLRTPKFAPFAGRKANVLMLPAMPRIVTAADVPAAFAGYDAKETPEQQALRERWWLRPRRDEVARIYVDVDLVPHHTSGQVVDRIEQRRDIPESRSKWRFGLRSEALLKTSGGTL